MLLSMALVVLCNMAPWYVSVLLSVSLILGIVFIFNLQWGIYFLLTMVLILGNQVGLSISPSKLYYNKPLPIFLFFLISSIFCFGLKKLSKLELNESAKNPLKVPFIILICYSMITLLWSPKVDYGLLVIVILSINAVLFGFVITVINNENTHRNCMWFWVVSGLVTAVLTIISIVLHPEIEIREALVGKIGFVLNWNPKVNIRGYALSHPNHTSLILNITISICYGMLLVAGKRILKTILFLSLLLMIFANFLTLSKGGIGSFLIMGYFLVFFSSLQRKQIIRNTFLFTVIWISLLVLALAYLNQIGVPKHAQITENGQVFSLSQRFIMWKSALHEMAKRSLTPFGLSSGGFDYYVKFPHAHNIYLSFFFDFGLAGIAFVISVLFVILRLLKDASKAIYNHHTYLQRMALAFSGGLIAIGIHSLIDHYYNKHIIWFFLAFAVLTLQMTKAEFTRINK